MGVEYISSTKKYSKIASNTASDKNTLKNPEKVYFQQKLFILQFSEGAHTLESINKIEKNLKKVLVL